MYSLRVFLSILLGLAIGALVGYLLAPKMHVPHVGKEELLRQRAVEFYAASRRLDRWTMVRMFTPARQLEQADKLRKDAEGIVKAAEARSANEKKEAEETASGIKAGDIKVQLEGNWAVTSGKYNIVAFGTNVPAQLDRLVWVYDGGQWWQYNFELPERNAYGHPPDFAMDLDPWK
jgi:hypothetical protein